MSRKGTNFSSVRVLLAHPVAIRDGPRASSNHYSSVSPFLDGFLILDKKKVGLQVPNFLILKILVFHFGITK